jgi:hypothetical protein
MLNTQFFKKFAKPELKYIAGKRYSNLFVLSIILILSMVSIGLGEGAIIYLDKKMNNPFVSFVNVKIPMENPYTILKMEKIHSKDNPDINFYDFYGFKEPYAVYDNYANFTNKENDITKNAKVRKGSQNDPVYDFIKETDKITLNNNFKFDGWGCVVSLDYLKNNNKLNYDNHNIPFLNYSRQINGVRTFFSIPIQGVVKSFPDDIDVLVGEKLFNAFYDYNFWASLIDLDPNRTSYLQYYVDNGTKLEEYLIQNNFKEIEYDEIIHNSGKVYKRDRLSVEDRNNILANINENAISVLDFNLVNSPRDIDIDKELYVFKFYGKLDAIADFNSFLIKNTVHDGESLEIDMRIVENVKNFDLFNKLANLLSVALIAFCIFCLWLYITNLIVSHISKNKKNLGTLKAFGLSNNNIILIYSAISITLISISFVISFLVSKLIGPVIVPLVANYSEIGDASSLNYISYPIYILAAFFIVLPSIAIYLKLWWELRKSTPGDLIYGRE